MNRLKILIYSIVFVAILLPLTIFVAIELINPNHYKAQIIQMVHEKTGRDLEIKGDISLSFFPWMGVSINDIHLSNPVGFQPQAEFASLGEANVSVKIMPLLSHKIEVGEITLKNLHLNLYKNKAGMTNWQDLSNASTAHSSTAVSADSAQKNEGNPPSRTLKTMASIGIAGLNIHDANIHWHDDQKSQDIQISHLTVMSDHPQIGEFFPFHLDLDIDANQPLIAGHLSVQTQVKADVFRGYEVNQLTLNDINVIFESPQKAQRMIFNAKHLMTDFNAQTLVISQGVLAANGMSANIDMQVEHLLANPVMTLYPLSMNLYGGFANGKIVAALGGAIPEYILDSTVSNMDLTQLIQSGHLMGRANVSAHLTLAGKDKAALLSSLNGNVQFDVQKGALMGMDIPYQVERALALLKKQALPPSPIKNQTDFDVFKGTGQLHNGVLSNQDLFIQSPEFQATGNGAANLVTQALNYHLSIVGLHGVTNAQEQVVQVPSKTPIAVSITGTFDHPMIKPDINALIQSELGQAVIKRVEEKLQKLGPKGANVLKQFLQH